MAEIRAPKKGKGVPKESREENSIEALQTALSAGFPEVNWDDLGKELESREFTGSTLSLHTTGIPDICLALLTDT